MIVTQILSTISIIIMSFFGTIFIVGGIVYIKIQRDPVWTNVMMIILGVLLLAWVPLVLFVL